MVDFMHMGAHRIIFYNQKGGVGKTTVTVNLGATLADMGYRVLLIDLDAQKNLTGAISGNDHKGNIYQVITGQIDAASAVQTTLVKQLFLIPGSVDMAGLNIELADQDEKELFLKKTISSIEGDFDYILLDCPPSLGLETVNALVWCDYVVVPLQCEYLAMEGLNLILRTVANIRRGLNKDIRILGILFTMYSKRARLNQEVVEDITEFLPELVFKTIIPRTVRLAEAPSHGLPINYYDRTNIGTKAFNLLAKEVVERV